MSMQFQIILIAAAASAACSVLGVFLVLRKVTMMADAISHSSLLGIVVVFFFVKTLDSPLLIIGAGGMGLITVFLIETILKTKLMKEDVAIGIVYPFLFSIAIILIAHFGENIHLDTDSVLMGELAYAPLNRFIVNGKDIGPKALYMISGLFALNVLFISVFYKELKLAVFDAQFAKSIDFKPQQFIYALMFMVALTVVAVFEVVGTVMVVGLLAGPPMIASYFTKKLSRLLFLAPLIGIFSSAVGYNIAYVLNVSIAGAIISFIGVLFLLTAVFYPGKGIIAMINTKEERSLTLNTDLLLVHLLQHEVLGDALFENNEENIAVHFNWKPDFLKKITLYAVSREYFTSDSCLLLLTNAGKKRAKKVIER